MDNSEKQSESISQRITHTLPIHTNATATVRINGIGIFCFNDNPARFEMGFLNEPEETHPLIMRIHKNNCNPVVFDPPINIVGARVTIQKIEMGEQQGATGGVFEYRTNGPLDRFNQDFRWIVDFEDLYGSTIPFKSPSDFKAKLYMHDAVFYAEHLTPIPVNLHEGRDDVEGSPFGFIGRILCADIGNKNTDDILITIEKAEMDPQVIRLPLSDAPYKINFFHRCPVAADHFGDFEDYYEVINAPSPKKLISYHIPGAYVDLPCSDDEVTLKSRKSNDSPCQTGGNSAMESKGLPVGTP